MRRPALRASFLATLCAVLLCGWSGLAHGGSGVGGPEVIHAAAGPGNATNVPSTGISSQSPLAANLGLSVVFYPLLLLLLAGLAVYLMRSGWAAGLLRKKVPRKLQVSEIRPLGNRQFLVVAEYETTRLLLGVSQGRIDLLTHLSRESMDAEDFSPLLREDSSVQKP